MQQEHQRELRRKLVRTAETVKNRGRISRNAFIAGVSLVVLGFVVMAIGASGQFGSLLFAGIGITHSGLGFALIGALGIFLFRGFGYVWIREEFHDASMMELVRQAKSTSPTAR